MANNLKTRRRLLLRCLLVMVLSLIPTMLLAQRGNVSLNLQNEESVGLFGKLNNKRITHLCIVTMYLTLRRK